MQIDCAHKRLPPSYRVGTMVDRLPHTRWHRKPRRILGNWKSPQPPPAFLKASGSATETQRKKYNQSMPPQSATTRPRTHGKKIQATLPRAGRNADNVFRSTRPARRNPDISSCPFPPGFFAPSGNRRCSFAVKLIQHTGFSPESRMSGKASFGIRQTGWGGRHRSSRRESAHFSKFCMKMERTDVRCHRR